MKLVTGSFADWQTILESAATKARSAAELPTEKKETPLASPAA
jgi:hypothetical protein